MSDGIHLYPHHSKTTLYVCCTTRLRRCPSLYSCINIPAQRPRLGLTCLTDTEMSRYFKTKLTVVDVTVRELSNVIERAHSGTSWSPSQDLNAGRAGIL